MITRKNRQTISILVILCLILSVTDRTQAATSMELWPYLNAGDFSYEDNQDDWYGSLETIQSVSGIDVHIQPLWDRGWTEDFDADTIVAIVDTGINYTHPALQDRVWTNQREIPGDGIDNDRNGYIDDVYGWNFYENNANVYTTEGRLEENHGTHCAGTIVSCTTGASIRGVAQIAPNVQVMSVKVLGGLHPQGSIADLIQGIRYAENNGASICNLSIGLTQWSEELYQVMSQSDMLFVVAAGNGTSATIGAGYNLDDSLLYPACFSLPNMITVANLQCDGRLHYSSNYSKTYVDLAAPGSSIYSTSTESAGNCTLTGTSMAAPMVAGAAALIWSQDPSLSAEDVKQDILSTVRPLPDLMQKIKSGGTLDISAALGITKVQTLATPTPFVSTSPSPHSTCRPSLPVPTTGTSTEEPLLSPEPVNSSTPVVTSDTPSASVPCSPSPAPSTTPVPALRTTHVTSAKIKLIRRRGTRIQFKYKQKPKYNGMQVTWQTKQKRKTKYLHWKQNKKNTHWVTTSFSTGMKKKCKLSFRYYVKINGKRVYGPARILVR